MITLKTSKMEALPGSVSEVIIITGPSGVGKTTVAHCTKKKLDSLFPGQIRYLSGDMFSHISFPWIANDEQLDRKYDCLKVSTAHLLERDQPIILIIDDLFVREKDLQGVLGLTASKVANAHTYRLQADLPELLQRNSLRTGLQRIADEKVRDAFNKNGLIDWRSCTTISAMSNAETVADEMVRLFTKR